MDLNLNFDDDVFVETVNDGSINDSINESRKIKVLLSSIIGQDGHIGMNGKVINY